MFIRYARLFKVYTYLYLYKNLDFLTPDVGSIHFHKVVGYLSRGLNLKIPHFIYSGTIPDIHILDLFLHLQMKIKSSVHFQYYNSRNFTILYIFQIKKKISRIHSAQYFFFKRKKAAKYVFDPITWENMHTFWKEKKKKKKKKIVKCMVIFYGIIILLLLSLILLI